MAATGKGSKIKTVIELDENSLGDKSLSEMGYRIDFYARHRKECPVTGIYTVHDTDATTKVVGNAIISMCDTTDLDIGQLYASLTLTYTDAELNTERKEVLTLKCEGVVIDDAPLAEEVETS